MIIAVDETQIVFARPQVEIPRAVGLGYVESMTALGIHEYRIKQQSIGRDRMLAFAGVASLGQARKMLTARAGIDRVGLAQAAEREPRRAAPTQVLGWKKDAYVIAGA